VCDHPGGECGPPPPGPVAGDARSATVGSDPPPAPPRSRRGSKRLITPSPGALPPLRRPLTALWRRPGGSPTGALSNALHPRISGGSPDCRRGVAARGCRALAPVMGARAPRARPRRHPRPSGWGRTPPSGGRPLGPRRDLWGLQDPERPAPLRPFAGTRRVRQRLGPQPSAPDDPPLPDDGPPRGSSPHALAARLRHLASRPQGRWPLGLQGLANDEDRRVPPGLPKHPGGTDDRAPRRRVPASGHRPSHRPRAPLGGWRGREPWTRCRVRPVLRGRGDGHIISLPNQLAIAGAEVICPGP
jgi:hypothetical protein